MACKACGKRRAARISRTSPAAKAAKEVAKQVKEDFKLTTERVVVNNK